MVKKSKQKKIPYKEQQKCMKLHDYFDDEEEPEDEFD